MERSGDPLRVRQTGAAASWSPLRARLPAAPAPQTAPDTSAAATAAGSACAAAQVSTQSTYRGVEMKQGECICPLSWSIRCSFVRDGNYSEGGWAMACMQPPPSPAKADFSMMGVRHAEIGSRHSVSNLKMSTSKYTKDFLVIFFPSDNKSTYLAIAI